MSDVRIQTTQRKSLVVPGEHIEWSMPARAFIGFDLWMTGQLRQLVDQWAQLAAPRAERTAEPDRRS